MSGGLPKLISSTYNISSSNMPSAIAVIQAAQQGKTCTDTTPLSQLESHMETLFNRDRSSNGLPTLQTDSSLENLARKYAQVLLANGGVLNHFDKAGHSPQDRANQAGFSCVIRENLSSYPRWSAALMDTERVSESEKAMINEPPNQENHRANILCADGKAVGIGIARNGATLVMVQEISCK